MAEICRFKSGVVQATDEPKIINWIFESGFKICVDQNGIKFIGTSPTFDLKNDIRPIVEQAYFAYNAVSLEANFDMVKDFIVLLNSR